jgi:hypothetical protein
MYDDEAEAGICPTPQLCNSIYKVTMIESAHVVIVILSRVRIISRTISRKSEAKRGVGAWQRGITRRFSFTAAFAQWPLAGNGGSF